MLMWGGREDCSCCSLVAAQSSVLPPRPFALETLDMAAFARTTTFQKKRAADTAPVCIKKGHRWGSCERIVSANAPPGDEARVTFMLVWAGTLNFMPHV